MLNSQSTYVFMFDRVYICTHTYIHNFFHAFHLWPVIIQKIFAWPIRTKVLWMDSSLCTGTISFQDLVDHGSPVSYHNVFGKLKHEMLLFSLAVTCSFIQFTRLFKYVMHCFLLTLLSSVCPLRIRLARPSFLSKCPQNSSCLFSKMVFKSFSLAPAILNTFSLLLWSVHDILSICLWNHITEASNLCLVWDEIAQHSLSHSKVDNT